VYVIAIFCLFLPQECSRTWKIIIIIRKLDIDRSKGRRGGNKEKQGEREDKRKYGVTETVGEEGRMKAGGRKGMKQKDISSEGDNFHIKLQYALQQFKPGFKLSALGPCTCGNLHSSCNITIL
jgi:hypothetical protein